MVSSVTGKHVRPLHQSTDCRGCFHSSGTTPDWFPSTDESTLWLKQTFCVHSTHHNQFSLVVTFSYWVNYSPLIVTLCWLVWLFRLQQDHFAFYIPRGYTSVVICFELPSGIEPNYPDYKSGASPAMLWKQFMYQFHTDLLGTIRVSRTRCTTQIGYNVLSITWLHLLD